MPLRPLPPTMVPPNRIGTITSVSGGIILAAHLGNTSEAQLGAFAPRPLAVAQPHGALDARRSLLAVSSAPVSRGAPDQEVPP